MTQHLGSRTMPDFFGNRYGSRALKIAASVIVFVFLVPYTASIYNGLSRLFEMAFHIPYTVCVAGMAVFTGIYVILGGYMATAINDFIQGIIMLFGICAVIGAVLIDNGGLIEATKSLASVTGDAGWKGAYTAFLGPDPLALLFVVILTSLGTWGLPQMVHKFYTIKDNKSIKQAAVISTLFALLIGGSAYFIGAFARLFLGNQVPAEGFDAVMPLMLNKALPAVMMGVLLVLILSASMSTLSSVVMTSSSSIAIDLVKGKYAPDMSEKDTVGLMRILCVVFVGLSFAIAAFKPKEIITLMSFSWGTLAGTFLGPYLWGLYSKKITRIGAWSGMVLGFLTSIVPAVVSGFNAQYAPTFGMVAMIVSIIITPLVSRYTPKYKDDFIKGIFD